MKRRQLLSVPCALAFPAPILAAEKQPWSARLLKGGFDGTHWWSGLEIKLAPHWKTYWRVPGDGGIAPSLALSGDNLKSSRVDYPFPSRITTENGTTIGYEDSVVFPFALMPAELEKPVTVKLKAFFGVCEDVCIPAPFDAAVSFDPANSVAPDQALISKWLEQVPVAVTDGPIVGVRVKKGEETEDFYVSLDLKEQIGPVFIEGNPMHFFANPLVMRGVAAARVSGVKSLDELKATPLRVTMKAHSKLLEQMVSVV